MQRIMRCTVHPIPPIELLLAEIHKPIQLVRGILVRNTLQGKYQFRGSSAGALVLCVSALDQRCVLGA